MIQKPYVLAEIEQDFTGLAANVYSCDVFGVAGSKKQKRSELALAVDRQGVNIYDVQSSKTITSYAISPQAVFTCPPCSIRSRRLGDEPARRYTYCSVVSPKSRILCFSESTQAEITTTSINVRKEVAPILHLDTFEAGSGSKVLALHKDGTVTVYSKDLATEEWHRKIKVGASESDSMPTIYAAAILSLQQARKAILKGREDILATWGQSEDAIDPSLLLVMTRAPAKDANSFAGKLELQILSIKVAEPDTDGFAIGAGQKMQPVATLAMPEPSLFTTKKSQITMHTLSGTIYQDAEGVLAVYNLTGSVPRIVRTLVRKDAFSFLRLSPELIACGGGTSLSVIDLQYGSLQAESTLTLNHESNMVQEFENSKETPSITTKARLLSYFGPLDVIVAFDGRKLLAIQLSTTQKLGGTRKRKRDGLLVKSIGRGSSSMTATPPLYVEPAREIKSLGTYLPSSDSQIWKDQEAALNWCLAQNDLKELEKLMTAALGIKPFQEEERISDFGGQNHVDQHVVSYVLHTMFSMDRTCSEVDPDDSDGVNLSIRIYLHRIGKWLIDKGLLSLNLVEASLKKHQGLPVTSKLASGSLIRALAKLDPSLEILLSVLASPVPLSPQELVHILVIITQGSNAEATEGQQLLANGDGEDSGSKENIPLVNGQLTNQPPSPSSFSVTHKSHHRLLNLSMKRLYAYPSSSVARALKRELSTLELRILVDTLRIEIARSGWLSLYEESPRSPDHDVQSNSQMCFIMHLLNCVIDSLGTCGWILGNSTSDDFTETADTIAYMRAEVSAALESIEEATYLKGMLGEILLCGKDSLNSSVRQSEPTEDQLSTLPMKPMSIALIEDPQILPLGLKPTPVISTTKIGAGGELIKRSKRDIGRLKSKMVGKYSFDRITV